VPERIDPLGTKAPLLRQVGFDLVGAVGTLRLMQTVAAAPDSLVAVPASASAAAPAPVLDASAPVAPFLHGSYAESLGRPRGHPALPDDEWDDSATDEERFAALKAALEEGFRAHAEGDFVRVPANQLGAFLNEIGERASRRLNAKRAHA